MLYNTTYFAFMLFKTIFCLEFLGIIISSSFISSLIGIVTALFSNISTAVTSLLISIVVFSLLGLTFLLSSKYKKKRYKLKS